MTVNDTTLTKIDHHNPVTAIYHELPLDAVHEELVLTSSGNNFGSLNGRPRNVRQVSNVVTSYQDEFGEDLRVV